MQKMKQVINFTERLTSVPKRISVDMVAVVSKIKIAFLMVVTLTILASCARQSPSGTAFIFQGTLNGEATHAMNVCDFRFALYDQEFGGSRLSDTLSVDRVPIIDGDYSVELDFGQKPFEPGLRFLNGEIRCPSGQGDFDVLLDRQAIRLNHEVFPEFVYRNEKYQGRIFASADEWNDKIKQWESIKPNPINVVSTASTGVAVGLEVSKILNEDSLIRNDKWKHCVAGVEIALATDFNTAQYAGWSKEYQDLIDGKSNTSFDETDYSATLDGANLIVQESLVPETNGNGTHQPIEGYVLCQQCADICELRWGSRFQPWNGNTPVIDESG